MNCPGCGIDALVTRSFKGDYPAPARVAYYCTECMRWWEREPNESAGAELDPWPNKSVSDG